MKPKVTTAIILEKRTKKKDCTYPVKLRITYERKQRYFNTGFSLSKKDFSKVTTEKPRGEYKEIGLELARIESKANDLIKEMTTFSFEAFARFQKIGKAEANNVFWGYQAYIDRLLKEDRIGTAESYTYSLKSLRDYLEKEKLFYHEVTPMFLEAYRKWMIRNGKSNTTIGIYLRCLRSIFNEAIQAGTVKPDLYPFGRRRFEIPGSQNIKKAISLEEIGKIMNYPVLKGSSEQRARDYWIFSYLGNGINVKDLARLKYKNVDFENETITFFRSKTERTTISRQKPISIVLLPEIKDIISRWGNDSRNPKNYLFPILNKEMTPLQEHARIRQTVKDINKYIDRIARDLGITKKVTTYTARHSFSTILKRSGASIEFISESLGHSDIKTTENYLDSFEDSVKKEFAKKLIPGSKRD